MHFLDSAALQAEQKTGKQKICRIIQNISMNPDLALPFELKAI